MNSIQILYENNVSEQYPTMKTGWGFSAYIEWDGKQFFFDVGWDGDRILENLKTLNIKIDRLDAIILSHSHWDHTGGLPKILNSIPCSDIYLPVDYSKNQMNEIRLYGLTIYQTKGFQILKRLSENVALTGTCGKENEVGEQALILRISGTNDCILIVGCSHPGLEAFASRLGQYGKLKYIIGGLHGFDNINWLKNQDLAGLYIGHCTEKFDVIEKNIPPTLKISVGVKYNFN